MRLIFALFISISLTSAVTPTVAQESRSDAEKISALEKALENADAKIKTLSAIVEQYPICATEETSESCIAVRERHNQHLIDRYDDAKLLRAHTRFVFRWQLLAAWAMLFMVLGVAGFGVFLSYQEVMATIRAPQDARTQFASINNVEVKSAEETQAVAKQQTELVLSLQKLQLTSAVTGVIILGLSLGFLFLFLQYVFEIEPLDSQPSTEQTEARLPDE